MPIKEHLLLINEHLLLKYIFVVVLLIQKKIKFSWMSGRALGTPKLRYVHVLLPRRERFCVVHGIHIAPSRDLRTLTRGQMIIHVAFGKWQG